MRQRKDVLEEETVYIELLQVDICNEIQEWFYYNIFQENPDEKPSVLANFECSVFEFLFPYPEKQKYPDVVEVDLLMDPTKDFPGIISPKVGYTN